MTLDDLEVLESVNLKDIKRDEVIDIDDINIEPDMTKLERIEVFLNATSNPYFVKVGDILVKMSFSDINITIDECIERYLIECMNDRL